jgi:RimJ/RimL family protein N-acetyltransferase
MRVEKYGVVLDRLTRGDIEMVRQWRNSPAISQFMVYRDYITPEMQEKWFASLDPERDFHFIVRYLGTPCGLADIKGVDWDLRTFVTGIFLAPEHWNTDVAMRVAYAIHDLAFFELDLAVGFGQVVRTNRRAVRFNLSLGYRLLNADAHDSIVHEMRVERQEYEHATQRLRSYLERRSESSPS